MSQRISAIAQHLSAALPGVADAPKAQPCAATASYPRPEDAIAEIFALYSKNGDTNYIGEEISQIEHAVQAARFADLAGFDEETQLAALFHDVGHLMDGQPQMEGNLGVLDHEKVGADYLAALGFSPKTCALVRRHVDAKRYLCRRDPTYLKRLSEASYGTLQQQGGVMSEEEAAAFESADPLFASIVAMRTWDEKAKMVKPSFPIKSFEEYRDTMRRCLRREASRKVVESTTFAHYNLTPAQKRCWYEKGYLLLTDLFSEEKKKEIIGWCREVEAWPPAKGKHMVYYEEGRDGPDSRMLCRTENFLPYHAGLRALLTEGAVEDVLTQCFGEAPVLFKEKTNYKSAGGGAFPAHQDFKAFSTFGQKSHLTLNIAIDEATPLNGCLEVAPGRHMEGEFDPDPSHGGLTAEAEAAVDNWIPVPLKPGDALIFSSWLPHRSKKNDSDRNRAALYVTYNAASDGDFRADYYADKLAHFPQELDRIPGVDYSEGAKTYNLATPIVG